MSDGMGFTILHRRQAFAKFYIIYAIFFIFLSALTYNFIIMMRKHFIYNIIYLNFLHL